MRVFIRRAVSLLPVILLIAAAPALASPVWTSLGPFGGDLNGVAVDPRDARTVYAAAGTEGLFKSMDAGATWTKVLRAYTAARPAVDPEGVLYVAASPGKVKKSTDGGLHWTPAGQGLPDSLVTALAVDPAVPSRLYALMEARLWRSTDAGASWQPAPTRGLSRLAAGMVRQVAVARRPAGTVYIGSLGVWKSWNGGRTWHSASNGLPAAPVRALAVSPTDSRTLYASLELTGGVYLYRSRDGGESWQATAQLPPPGKYQPLPVNGLEVSPRSPLLVFATTTAGLYRSTDGGAHWTAVGPDGTSFGSVAVAPSALRYVYGTAEGSTTSGVMVSEDGGLTWAWRNRGLAAVDSLALVPDPNVPGALWLNTSRRGLFRGAAGGRRWRRQIPQGQVLDVTVPPLAPSSAYALVYPYGSGSLGVWWNPDGGAIWTQSGSAGGLNPKQRLWTDPADPDGLWASSEGSLYRSADGGAAWEYQDVTEVSTIALFDLRFAPSWPLTAYLAGVGDTGASPATRAEVFRTDDGGANWTRADAGLDVPAVQELAVDPVDPRRVYAATRGYFGTTGDGVWVTVDGGVSWARAGEEMKGQSVTTVAASPIAGVVWAATEDGRLFRSGNGGAAWEDRTADFPPAFARRLLFDPFDPRRLYAATSGGVYTTVDEP